tara:strand:+ start:886 stop:1095 length:210 start_codon:yes stop_codon:yes gene_type:complete
MNKAIETSPRKYSHNLYVFYVDALWGNTRVEYESVEGLAAAKERAQFLVNEGATSVKVQLEIFGYAYIC